MEKKTAFPVDKAPFVGILMLQTQFPRILGDIGCAESWPFPVLYKTVNDASAKQAVLRDANALTPLFIQAANELVESGAGAITTSCGFLSLVQTKLTEAIPVPVITSSLMQIPWINTTLSQGLQTGIITINAGSLGRPHLAAVNAPMNTPIVGTDPHGEFATTILKDEPSWNASLCRDEIMEAAEQLQRENSHLGAIVLECTNMVPYGYEIHKQTGLPVYSIHTLVRWLYSGLIPQRFDQSSLT